MSPALILAATFSFSAMGIPADENVTNTTPNTFVSYRVALIEAHCGSRVATRRGSPIILLVPLYQDYCMNHVPVAMFAHLEDGRSATVEVCNLDGEIPKVYCPPSNQFDFEESVRFNHPAK